MKPNTLIALLGVLLIAPACVHAGDRQTAIAGQERTWSLHEPPGAAGEGPLPLVIVLHGGLGSGQQAEQSYGWNALADREGFLVAYPDGLKRTWNAGGNCCGPAARNQTDDVALLDRLIASLVTGGAADPQRVYLAGISNGGAMAYRYACEGAHRVAAIGSVSGAMTADCASPRPVSVMEIHGMQDRTIPITGGEGRRKINVVWPAAGDTMQVFRTANDCEAAPARERLAMVERVEWSCPDGRAVSLVTIADAGHQWPGSEPVGGFAARLLDLDPPSNALDATATLWRFFEDHTPGRAPNREAASLDGDAGPGSP